ncbi:hypothetical protein C1646_775458 [Rhizophagus diaphanus]|nr:hypothetical protein C1646_775458 [Rhizophagus diaphanus] [Rhizophagus sp. MUCL 43196]
MIMGELLCVEILSTDDLAVGNEWLSMFDKYENNIWLGLRENKKPSMDPVHDEWPDVTVNQLLKMGISYVRVKDSRIYSTPDIDVASEYAAKFTHEGDRYQIVFQNRINPTNLVRVSKEETGFGEYWISSDGKDLRSYGIYIKKYQEN